MEKAHISSNDAYRLMALIEIGNRRYLEMHLSVSFYLLTANVLPLKNRLNA